MSVLKFSFVLMALLIFSSQFYVSKALAKTSEDQAASALANVEESVVSACQAVSKAEDSGANVSSLLIRLNEAGGLLDRAQIAYKSGDFDSALKFATESQERLNGFIVDADAAREAAMRDGYIDFLVNVAGSIIGAVGVVCVGFIVWFFSKRKYKKVGSVV